tara:strand:- start:931 stop:1302 length:372 start_codon:yes stop_codon:yes gene_type:complete
MAITNLDTTYCTYKLNVDTDCGTSTVQNITNGAGTVYSILVNNGDNNASSFLKLYDNLVDGGIDQNGTEADYIFAADASTEALFAFPAGLTISNGLSLRCVAGYALSNVSDPSSNVTVTIVYK